MALMKSTPKVVMINNVELTIATDYEELSTIAAKIITNRVKAKPNISLLLSTGATQKRTFELIAEKRKLFKASRIYNMYEYYDNETKSLISAHNPSSFKRYMDENFFQKITVKEQYFPEVGNVTHEGEYDEIIHRNGGIDFALAATGVDAHTFGFNFPGSSFQSETRLVEINRENRDVIKKATGRETPQHAITTGIKTGIEAREVLFLIAGKSKAPALWKILTEPVSEDVPATILRRHPNCRWIVDNDAASLLEF